MLNVIKAENNKRDVQNEERLNNHKKYMQEWGKRRELELEKKVAELGDRLDDYALDIREALRWEKAFNQLMKDSDYRYGKLNALIASMPLSDPTIPDIRVVRAIDKRRIKTYNFMPMVLYAETIDYRNYHRFFENTFSEPMTRYDAGYGRASLL